MMWAVARSLEFREASAFLFLNYESREPFARRSQLNGLLTSALNYNEFN